MKQANSSTVRTALHEMRLFLEVQRAHGDVAVVNLLDPQIRAMQKAVDDDDFHDPRRVRLNADGQWEDIPDAP